MRIEIAAGPLEHRLPFRVPRISDDLEELCVAVRPADVLRRAGARTGSAARVLAAIAGYEFFKFQRVFPVIAKVIAIPHWIGSVGEMSRDRHLPARQARPFIGHVLVGYADSLLAPRPRLDERELVKVIVLPPHRVLNRHVQVPE